MIRDSFDAYAALFAGQPKVMVAKEVAAVLRMSHKTVYVWAKDGYLPAEHYRGQVRFIRDKLIEWARDDGTYPRRKKKDR